MDLTLPEYWLLLYNSMSMCEMPIGIYELGVTAIVIMRMQAKVFNNYC